jgi:hypothetical protein
MSPKPITAFFIILLAIVAFSCDKCLDCGVPAPPPNVQIQFFNLSTAQAFKDSISDIDIKLLEVNRNINNETSEAQIQKLKLEKELLESQKANYNDTIRKINRGLTHIKELIAFGENSIKSIRDTTHTSFRLPLDINASSSTFIIIKPGKNDTLTFLYDKFQAIRANKIIFRAADISLNFKTHCDSIRVECVQMPQKLITCLDDNLQNCEAQKDCISNDILYKVYY